jgi:hypothetical protein
MRKRGAPTLDASRLNTSLKSFNSEAFIAKPLCELFATLQLGPRARRIDEPFISMVSRRPARRASRRGLGQGPSR